MSNIPIIWKYARDNNYACDHTSHIADSSYSEAVYMKDECKCIWYASHWQTSEEVEVENKNIIPNLSCVY